MKGLKLEKNQFGLKVYCSKCKRQYNEKTISNCIHPLYQKYRLIVYEDGKPITKSLDTSDYEEALIQAIKIKKELRLGARIKPVIEKHDPNSLSIIQAANLYIDYRHGNGVLPQHEYKNRCSEETKKNIIFFINQFIQVLRDHHYNPDRVPFAQISDKHIGHWYKFITSHYGQGTWNTPLSYIRKWFNHMRTIQKVKMIDPLEGVSFKKKVNKITAISKEQFNAVIEAIESKDQYSYLGCKSKWKKNMHRDWLESGFKLALYTGLRNFELVSLTWKNVHHNSKTDTYMIICENFKVENLKGEAYKPKYIPCGPDLIELLTKLGLKELINTDYHIIDPNRTSNYDTMAKFISKAWSHYFKQAHPDTEPMPFKNLRKTYLSALNAAMGNDMIEFSSHSGMEVLEKHYLDPKKVAKRLNVKIFD